MKKLLALLKNKKFWAAVAISAAAAGSSVDPRVIVAVGDIAGAVVESMDTPATVVEPMPVQLAP